ncbi:MAG: hypothetical protein H8E38_08885 [SAR324 cluster bacterium]|nr:hypothetical protein [SAR324 cluster bacterium]MBL7034319.1 hypothetical protein [SAR324 cluster bacterium]
MPFDKKIICSALQKADRPELAKILAEIWEMPLTEYAKLLWSNSTVQAPFETELQAAFETEFCRIGYTAEEAKDFSMLLKRNRVLQTATHLTASEGPTFLALHHLSLLALPAAGTYFVGAYSGVSFANSAWSGCLNFSSRFELEEVIGSKSPTFAELKRADLDRLRDSEQRRISLIPGSMRDSRVFQSKVPEKLVNLLDYAAEPLRRNSPKLKAGAEFTAWAAEFCANQLRQIVPGKSLLYFDLNEVIRTYLLLVLKNSEHPLFHLLFTKTIRNSVLAEFSQQTPFFSVEVKHKNRIRQEALIFKGDLLQSQNFQIEATPENIIRELESGTLCPGLFLTFTTLCFINSLTCFGSFEQVEYLAEFKRKWLKLDLLEQEIVSAVNTAALTSGRSLDQAGTAVHPLDMLLGLDWSFQENQSVGELMMPLLPRLGIKC